VKSITGGWIEDETVNRFLSRRNMSLKWLETVFGIIFGTYKENWLQRGILLCILFSLTENWHIRVSSGKTFWEILVSPIAWKEYFREMSSSGWSFRNFWNKDAINFWYLPFFSAGRVSQQWIQSRNWLVTTFLQITPCNWDHFRAAEQLQ
jgi:hypothetical protein